MVDKIPYYVPFEFGWNVTPVAFYPYTSVVLDRVFQIDCSGNLSNFFEGVRTSLIYLFNSKGIKAQKDNKIVFEIRTKSGKSIFIGFFDLVLSVGFQVDYEGKVVVEQEASYLPMPTKRWHRY